MNIIKKISVLTFTALSMIMSSSCIAVTSNDGGISGREQVVGSGNKISKDIPAKSDFTKISVPSIIDVVVQQGSANSIKVEGSDNLIKYCNINVANNTLNIELTKEADRISFKKFDVKVYVTAKALSDISISGTGDVDFKGNFNTSNLNLDISGTGDITIPALNANDFKVSISGTGDVKAKATCSSAWLYVSGTGDINAELLSLKMLEAQISGTGDIDISGSTETASYSISGTGDIEAKNMIAKSVIASSNGTGDIDCYASESFSGTKSVASGLKCYGNPAKYDMKKN